MPPAVFITYPVREHQNRIWNIQSKIRLKNRPYFNPFKTDSLVLTRETMKGLTYLLCIVRPRDQKVVWKRRLNLFHYVSKNNVF